MCVNLEPQYTCPCAEGYAKNDLRKCEGSDTDEKFLPFLLSPSLCSSLPLSQCNTCTYIDYVIHFECTCIVHVYS